MKTQDLIQALLLGGGLLALVVPLGAFIHRAATGKPHVLSFLKPVECALYRLSGVAPERGMNWRQYTVAMLLFNVLGLVGPE